MNGAEFLVTSLINHGTDTVFGYPGATVLSVYDSLYKHRKEIKHVRTAHEQGAAHAADGYARASGKPGVCIVTSGPGATNIVTGIANAFMDSIPVIFITGNVDRNLIGTDSFQEVDITGITLSITKHSYLVRSADDLAKAIDGAYRISMEGRKGPVLIDIPKDILEGKYVRQSLNMPASDFCTVQSHAGIDGSDSFERAADLILGGERPLVLFGGGVKSSAAAESLIKFSGLINAPMCSSLMGVGIVPYDHPMYLGPVGKNMKSPGNIALSKCDVLITVGTRFSNRMNELLSENVRIIQIESDRAEIGKLVEPELYILGDAGQTLERLISEISQKGNTSEKAWDSILPEIRKEAESCKTEEDKFISDIFERISKIAGKDAFVVTDVGNHQMAAARMYPFSGNGRFITSGGLGTMGFGMGASIGASCFSEGTPAVLVTGDGSFGMNLGELATVSRYRIPLIVLVMNNRKLGMVYDIQKKDYSGRISQTDMRKGSDFVKIARGFGISAARINKNSTKEYINDIFEEIKTKLDGKNPFVLDVRL